jgi:hypothetical protein
VTIDGAFMFEKQFLIGPVRDRHDVDVAKFGAGFAPVAMGQDMVPADFAARFEFASRRHGPMEKSVEPRDPNTRRGRLHVFEKRRKTADDFPRIERLGDPAKLFQFEARFRRARLPRRSRDLARLEFPLQRHQDFPFQIGQLGHMDRRHRGRRVRLAAGLNRLPANVAHAESENSFRRHQPEMVGANDSGEKLAVMVQGKSARDFQRRPEFVFRAGRNRIGGTQNDVAGERVALRHEIERRVDPFRRDFPGDERPVGKVSGQQCLPDPADGSRFQHRCNARHHRIDRHAGAPGNFLERFPNEPVDLVFRNGEDLRVGRIVVFHRQHGRSQ